MFARNLRQPEVRPVTVFFGRTQIPAEKYYDDGKVHYRLAWDRNIESARIVLSYDIPRGGRTSPVKGSRVRVRVEIGSGAMTRLLGETYTDWRGKNRTFIWMADYGRLKGLQ